MDLWTQCRREGEGQMEKVALTYIHYYGKKIVGEKLLYNTGSSALLCDDLREWDGG